MPTPGYSPTANVSRTLANLDKYAGWLGRGIEPRRVREDVQMISALIDSGCDIQSAVETLEIDIGKVPASHVGALLRKAVRGLRLEMGMGEAMKGS
jgi:hypothetical protein